MPGRRFPAKQSVGNRNRTPFHGRALQLQNTSNAPSTANAGYQTGHEDDPSHTSVTLVPFSHPKIPDLPCMHPISFEIFFFAYLLTALFGQYLFIYKTVWWYPSTLPPSTTTINFHLIDSNLTRLLIVFFSGRLLWTLLWKHLKPCSENILYLFLWILMGLTVACVWVAEITQNLFALHERFTTMKLMFLLQPILLWLPVFWMFDNGVFSYTYDLLRNGGKNNNRNSIAFKSSNRLQDQPESIGDGKTSYANLGNASDAEQVREEVNLLLRDFNSRLAEILVTAMLCAYYVGLIPIFYTEEYHSFEVGWSLQYTGLILLNSLSMLSSFLLPPRYLQVLHKCATLLGGYEIMQSDLPQSDDTNDECELGSCQEWSPQTVYSKRTNVKYRDRIYAAVGKHNTAQPDDVRHSKFFDLFHRPLRILNWILALHFGVVLFQLYVIISSSRWDQLIAPALLQFFSYFILFATLRDRIVLGKAYAVYESSAVLRASAT